MGGGLRDALEQRLPLGIELPGVFVQDDVREALDRPQGRAQVVGRRVGEVLEIVVGLAQLGGALLDAGLEFEVQLPQFRGAGIHALLQLECQGHQAAVGLAQLFLQGADRRLGARQPGVALLERGIGGAQAGVALIDALLQPKGQGGQAAVALCQFLLEGADHRLHSGQLLLQLFGGHGVAFRMTSTVASSWSLARACNSCRAIGPAGLWAKPGKSSNDQWVSRPSEWRTMMLSADQ